jgi:hypothetical protein
MKTSLEGHRDTFGGLWVVVGLAFQVLSVVKCSQQATMQMLRSLTEDAFTEPQNSEVGQYVL